MSFAAPQSSLDNAHISIPLGITIGLIASFIQSLGLTIQRKSHVLNQSLPKHRQRVEHRRPLWLLGFATFILSNLIGSLVQIASLPVVILAPLGAVSLLWNAFFARLLLGDVFSPWMVIGTILIAGGAVLIAIFGIVPEPTHSLDDLLELFRRPTFIIYFSLLGMVVFLCLATTHIGEFSWARKTAVALRIDSPSSPIATSSGDDPTGDLTLSNTVETISDVSTITEATPLLDRKRNHSPPSCTTQHQSLDALDRTRVLLAISYASISGIISGMCLIFAKSGVELLLLTVGGKNQFRRWESWVLIFSLIVFALLQMWYLHKALVLANPTLVCPSAFCFYNLSSIVNGLVYFDQVQFIKASHLCLVGLGIVILLGGVWVVSIHSGGGGVDVGTWSEEDEDVIEDETALSISEAEQEETAPPDTAYTPSGSDSTIRSTSTRKPFGPIPIARHSISEPVRPTLATSSETREPQSSQVVYLRPGHRHTMHSILLSPPSPTFRTRFTQRRPTTTSETHRFSTSSHQRNPSHPSNAFSPSINVNAVSTLGAGLQIGLSPISPGFSILPRERKRKTSGLSQRGDVEQSLQPRETRTRSVSEGTLRTLRPDLSLSSEPDGPDLAPDHQIDQASSESVPGPGRQRWLWLRDIFLRSK
ncbi:hypothetical protein D9756_003769 [Leucocoprinus leucothites]|uniref:Uncharacterized protein n=1 Tax=Leucocoprinus leucothites TaxID=201217 RepID=A0A8H5D8P4_9AGAR|nr:hypothetical protein D9756_003769 [Leucoagaricus leucothites]